MALSNYQFTDLQAAVEGRLHNMQALMAGTNYSEAFMLNLGVKDCLEIDFRSTKRKAAISPDLFDDIYQYACPTDLKKKKLVGLQPQNMDRSRYQIWNLVPEENFDQLKQTRFNLLSVSDNSFVRTLLASAKVDDLSSVVSELDSLTANGTWTGFGDGTNLSVDTYQKIKGNASIAWDISAAGGTTAGITASNVSTFDLTNYKSYGSVFVWAYITSVTNLTNYILRLGSSSSNYYSMTVTTQNDGTAFVAGWNLLRFDFNGKSTTGTPVDASGAYVAVYMTKTSGKISETSYRFDWICLKRGNINNLVYYSKYMWQSSGGTWKANSTASSDYLNVDEDEFPIVVERCTYQIARSIREYKDDAAAALASYERMKKEYRKFYKSEALLETTDYHYFN